MVRVQLFPMLPEDGENYDCTLKTGCQICSNFSQTFIFVIFMIISDDHLDCEVSSDH